MKDLNSKIRGLYAPSFFCMKIDASTLGDSMTDNELSLFIHEYVHFLQSFTTLYGLGRINADFSVITNIINYAKKRQRVFVPLAEEEVLDEQTFFNNKICDFTWGDTCDIDNMDIVEVSVDTESIIEELQIDTVAIFYIDKTGDESICSFGAREIYEGMAYLIEQHITKDYELSPDHPYNTAVKVTDYLYPQLLDDYRNLLVICDKALMSRNPGPEFIQIILWLKQIKAETNNPDKLYYYIEMNRKFRFSNESTKLIEFEKLARITRHHLHSLLQDDYFSDYHIWLDILFEYAIELRKNEPMFWLDIVDNGYATDNLFFNNILHFAGSPLIENNRHEYFYFSPEGADSDCLVYFKVFEQINKLLRKGTTMCELIPWCSKSPKVVNINESCYKHPWNHIEGNGELCPFKGVWQHWGLNPCDIVKRHTEKKTY